MIFSCAHGVYDNGWAENGVKFYPGYDSAAYPSSSGLRLRGYRLWQDYKPSVLKYGRDTWESFQWDFCVFYSYTDIGDSVGTWLEGGPLLMDETRWKLIAGYPTRLLATGAQGFYYQHSTPFFTNAARRAELDSRPTSDVYNFTGVACGPGNSGGPVFVYEKNNPGLAGVLVSGDANNSGVRAVNSDTADMANRAMGNAGISPRTFANKSSFQLPDGSTKFSSRVLKVSGFSARPKSVKFSLSISTTNRRDLEVYLKSPKGRIRWVSRRQGGAAKNLIVRNADYTADFYAMPNGSWEVCMRDVQKKGVARFDSCSLSILGR